MTTQATTIALPSRSAFRSIGAVLAGFAAIAVLSTLADLAMRGAGIYPADAAEAPSDVLFGLALAYRTVFGVLAGFIAAGLAPHHPMRHALVLGGIGVLVSVTGAITMWNVGPHWYPIGVVLICLPSAAVGALLQRKRAAGR
jgi:hypothetical protein